MATPEQLARFFSALEFDREDVVSQSGVTEHHVTARPRRVDITPELTATPEPPRVLVRRDPYRPMDPAWVIVGALILSVIFAAMRMGAI
jgi:hypothetical protein